MASRRGGRAGRGQARGQDDTPSTVSQSTLDKVNAMKRKVEGTIRHRIEDQNDRRVRQIKLEHALRDTDLTLEEKEAARADYGSQMSSRLRQERTRIGVRDFDLVTIIGKGAFGEVRIVKKKGTDDVYAMKTMRKRDMIAKNQGGHVQAERNLMVQADNPFLVKLFFSFQDSTYLYLVMEFCGGGDLMTILMREDILTEEATRFYMAELAAAINAVHELDFVHRDLKPDNILIANNGHIKLSDFGLAKSFNTENDSLLNKYTAKKDTLRDTTAAEDARSAASYRSGKGERGGGRAAREKMFSTVGTPDYIAPEVFSQKGYDKMVDWWSMGVIMFECLVGYPPFYAEDPLQTCRKIVHYRKYFRIPKDCSLSPQAVEVIHRLVCSPRRRAGFDWLRSCDFFGACPWDDLEQMEPTYVPDLSSAIDASNFDTIEPDQNDVDDEASTFKPSNAVSSSHFWNYTFARPLNQEDLSNPEEFLRKHGITADGTGAVPAAAAPASGAPAAAAAARRGGRAGGRGGRAGGR